MPNDHFVPHRGKRALLPSGSEQPAKREVVSSGLSRVSLQKEPRYSVAVQE